MLAQQMLAAPLLIGQGYMYRAVVVVRVGTLGICVTSPHPARHVLPYSDQLLSDTSYSPHAHPST